MTTTRAPLSADDSSALAALDQAIDKLLAGGGRTGGQQVEVMRRVEVAYRRLGSVNHAVINTLDRDGVARSLCLPDTAALLVRELHISPGDARARVRAAGDLGPRVGRDGEVLAPLFASVASAQSAGVLSGEHAAVIRRVFDGLSCDVEAEHGARLQEQLVIKAAQMNPGDLAKVATVLAASLDPDSGLSDVEIDRRRDAGLVQRRDGMFALSGVLTPECGAALRPVFDSLAAPRPGVDGAPDPRTPGQRMHDALHELALMVARTEQLPDCGGVVATILVTVTADQVESGAGYATTSHGDLVPVRRILGLALESQILPVLFDPNGGVMSYGRLRRLAPPGLRLALFARDRGCSFPDCDRPPQWCEAHHFREWQADDGPTSVANMGLVCRFHHREFKGKGWQGVMRDGVPYWVPPVFIDATRTPRRNTRHHPELSAA